MKHKSTWHLLHFILTIIFWPWIIVWVGCAASNSSYNAKQKLAFNNEVLEYLKNK